MTDPGRGAAHRAIGIRDKRRRDPSRSYEPNGKGRDRDQPTVMAVVPVAALAIWLTVIFLAAREPRGRAQAAAASPTGVVAPETGAECIEPVTVTGEGEPARPADGGIAA